MGYGCGAVKVRKNYGNTFAESNGKRHLRVVFLCLEFIPAKTHPQNPNPQTRTPEKPIEPRNSALAPNPKGQ
jgi:hypothetical protein